ncbi:hypothetical protein KIL84_002860 [Mauremys mutica]|uniref:Uncharacterized protein n=1 Tax=Mauremys mutica TaxID=74926 RepID=A0A9D3WSP4_9SAUR|nr:hypothetical protein KIL84_002860 [Mauremys mutica]
MELCWGPSIPTHSPPATLAQCFLADVELAKPICGKALSPPSNLVGGLSPASCHTVSGHSMGEPLAGPRCEGRLHTDPSLLEVGSEGPTSVMANQTQVHAWPGQLYQTGV